MDTIAEPHQTGYDSIPAELKALDQWVVWNPRDQRRRANGDGVDGNKIPLSPSTLANASSTDPATWGTWEQAQARAMEGYGVGFVLTDDDPYLCIDLDHVVDTSGAVADSAAAIVEEMGSYTEMSPSGTGVHVFCRAVKPGKKSRGGGVEMYTDGRYIRMTGRTMGGRDTIRNAQKAVAAVYRRHVDTSSENAANVPQKPPQPAEMPPDAQTVVELARRSAKGARFDELMRGDTSSYGDDHSRADLALCSMLAFFARGDTGLVDEIFRTSGLIRPKWDEMHGEQTYGEMTISQAMNQSGYYTGRRPDAPVSAPVWETPRQAQAAEVADGSRGEPESYEDKMRRLRTVDPAETALDIFTLADYQEPIPTGIKPLDRVLDGGLNRGVCILGAVSSIGKTTLTVQIADHIASTGRPVLFVTIEQSAQEIVAKSISRIMKQREDVAVSARDVLSKAKRDSWGNGEMFQKLDRAFVAYTTDISPHMRIMEGVRQPSVDDVRAAAEAMAEHEGVPPVVFIDYLQLLAPMDDRDTDKQAVDKNVMSIRQMARDMKTVVFAISSLNRSSYSGTVALDSFKESGAIEYGADVLLGLQPRNMGERLSDVPETKRKTEAEKLVRKAKAAVERPCEIVVLKQRNGRMPEDGLPVTFLPVCNLFLDEMEKPAKWTAADAQPRII